MSTNQITRIHGHYPHEFITEIIKKAGLYVRVRHDTMPHTRILPSGKKVNLVASTQVKIFNENPKNDTAFVLAAGYSDCVEGDAFSARFGLNRAIRNAYRQLREIGTINREEALKIAEVVKGEFVARSIRRDEENLQKHLDSIKNIGKITNT